MTALRALDCPRCGAPVTFAAQFCAYCRSTLVAGAPPELGRGNVLQSYDFTKGIMLPGVELYSSVRPQMGVGLEYTLAPAEANGLVSFISPPLRNGSALLRGICHDPFGKIALRFRVHRFTKTSVGYAVEVRPAHQSFMITRIASAGRICHDPIVALRTFPSIAGPGQPNEIEVRFADSVFNVVLNGTTAHSFVDARYGFGHAAVSVAGTPNQTARIILERVELRGPA